MDRRTVLTTLSGSIAASTLPTLANPIAPKHQFKYCLNVSTIRGQNLGFRKELEVAAQAGFQHVEIWINTFQEYLKQGNSLASTKRMITDLGLSVENAIGFAPWIIDDTTKRKAGLEQLKTEMEQLREIGCNRIAAPPMGATTSDVSIDLKAAAERYRAILELGDQTKVIPHLELWGFSHNLSKLSEVMYIAIEAGHPSARLLLDIYHLYKGGTDHSQLRNVGGNLIEIFHVNDYPANPDRANIGDSDRVYTGDGIAPVKQVLRDLKDHNKPIVLSLELFNKQYYAQPALEVAKTGLKKLKAVAESL